MKRNMTAILTLTAIIVVATPHFAAAQSSFDLSPVTSAGDTFLSWLKTFAKIVLSVGLIIAGLMAAGNRLSWMWPLMIAIGAFFAFGGSKLIDELATWFS